MKLVIVTGMSGAGKTIALKMLEDLGFYCVDNLPVSLVDKFVQLVSDGGDIKKAALGIDIRNGEGLDGLEEVTEKWRSQQMDIKILLLRRQRCSPASSAIRKPGGHILWQAEGDWKRESERRGTG